MYEGFTQRVVPCSFNERGTGLMIGTKYLVVAKKSRKCRGNMLSGGSDAVSSG